MAGLKISDFFPLIGLGNRSKAQETVRAENPLFDRAFYAERYPDVVKGGIDLYKHYSYFGCWNGYDPNPYFDSAWYIAQNKDVAATGVNPLDHFLDCGAIEGRNPSPAFSSWLYLIFFPDVKASGMNPLLHFMQHGKAEGRTAPPVMLVPALSIMSEPQTSEDLDPHLLQAAEPMIRMIRTWTGKLLDQIVAPAAV